MWLKKIMSRVITFIKLLQEKKKKKQLKTTGQHAGRTRLEATTKTPSLTFASRNVQQRDDYAPRSRKATKLINNSLFFYSVFHTAPPPGVLVGEKKKYRLSLKTRSHCRKSLRLRALVAALQTSRQDWMKRIMMAGKVKDIMPRCSSFIKKK